MLDTSLRDTSTQFLHHVSLLPQLEKHLADTKALGLIMVEIGSLDKIEQSHGVGVFNGLLQKISDCFNSMHGEIIRTDDPIAMSELGSTSYMIFVSTSRNKQEQGKILSSQNLQKITKRVEEHLIKTLIPILSPYQNGFPKISLGNSLAVYNPMLRKRRIIARLIEEAREATRARSKELLVNYKYELQRIIVEKDLRSLYQPIVHLKDRSIHGYEALSRGPKGSVFENPLVLFAVAEETGMSLELDRLCRYISIKNSKNIKIKNCHIFVNTLCDNVSDPEFSTKGYETLLAKIGRKPQDLVFEINEKTCLPSALEFRHSIEKYRKLGTSFALDDLGSGYASLQTMMDLKPKYSKLDRGLCTGAHLSQLKQETLSWFQKVSAELKSNLVAEGIETQEDLDFFKAKNVPLGQGFFFSRPLPPEDLSQI